MRRLLPILFLLISMSAVAQYAFDLSRIHSDDLQGTARYVGLAGAMVSLGGDPSAALDNPAALGVYQRHEASFTMAMGKKTFIVPQASINFYFPTGRSFSGILNHSLLLSYSRRNNLRFNQILESNRRDFCRTAYIDIRSSIDAYSFSYGMNISNRLYLGLGVPVYSMQYDCYEIDQYSDRLSSYSVDTVFVSANGVGIAANLGVIYRPISALRLGASIQTPTYFASRFNGDVYDYSSPLSVHAGAAYINKYGLLSFEYEFVGSLSDEDLLRRSKTSSSHKLKAGLEIVPISNLFIDLGYQCALVGQPQYEATDDLPATKPFLPTHYATAAISFRNQHMVVGVAYRYRLAHEQFLSLSMPEHFTVASHLVTLTMAWHSAR